MFGLLKGFVAMWWDGAFNGVYVMPMIPYSEAVVMDFGNPNWCVCECHGKAAPIPCGVKDTETAIEAATACVFCAVNHDYVFGPRRPPEEPLPPWSDGSDDTD